MGEASTRRRITIVDDHAEFLVLMQDLLSDQYDVATLSGHEISPNDITDSRPDLLMVDLRLDARDLQGWDIVNLVRAHRHLRKVPIIICSADVRELNGRADALAELGNTAMLAKPFALDDLERVVRGGLDTGFTPPESNAPAAPPGINRTAGEAASA